MHQLERVLLTGRNFEWAMEITGKTRKELEILFLEAKFNDVMCSVEVNR